MGHQKRHAFDRLSFLSRSGLSFGVRLVPDGPPGKIRVIFLSTPMTRMWTHKTEAGRTLRRTWISFFFSTTRLETTKLKPDGPSEALVFALFRQASTSHDKTESGRALRKSGRALFSARPPFAKIVSARPPFAKIVSAVLIATVVS